MSLRSVCHALFIVCIVQCFLGLPTRFLVAMFGRALPLNVAFLVGEDSGSLKVCISSLCCDALIWVDICSIRLRLLPSASAACVLTSLLVLFLSTKVVWMFSIFRSPLSWNVSSFRSCALVRYIVSSAYVSLVLTTAL